MSAQERINDYWTGRAPSYDADVQRPERFAADQETWSKIWNDALPAGPLDVLDVGTGSGQVAMVLAGLGHRVTGIDLAEGMLERARAHAATMPEPRPVITRGDAVKPDFTPGSFDAVTSRYLMWTLREPEAAVANWVALLRPGGLVAVVDTTWFPDGIGGADAFTRSYDSVVQSELPLATAKSIDETAGVLERAGLSAVTVTPLDAIYELDRRFGVSENHEHQMQYLVTGRV
jgi:SAM-dependent methyltransferase